MCNVAAAFAWTAHDTHVHQLLLLSPCYATVLHGRIKRMLRRQVSAEEADGDGGRGGNAETLPIRRPVTQQKGRHLSPLAEAFFHRKSSGTGQKSEAGSVTGSVALDSLPTTTTPSVPEDRSIDHGTTTPATSSLGTEGHRRISKTRPKNRTNVFGNPLLDRASAQVAVPEEATRAVSNSSHVKQRQPSTSCFRHGS